MWDSPNSAGIVIDAVRCAKLALDRGIAGALIAPSSYFMKSPPEQFPDDVCRRMVEDFIVGKGPDNERAKEKAARPDVGVAAAKRKRGPKVKQRKKREAAGTASK